MVDRRNFRIAGLAALTVLAGVAVVIAVAVSFGDDAKRDNSDVDVRVYPTNRNGQTYGASSDSGTLEEEPDLIATTADDGTPGYIKKDDIIDLDIVDLDDVNPPGTEPGSVTVVVPLYDEDGETIIGEVEIPVPALPDLELPLPTVPGLVP